MKDKSLQEARQQWVLAEIKKLQLESPVAELSRKLGVGMSLVSEVLNKKASVSLNFFKSFCEAYGFNHEVVNHTLIDSIKKKIVDSQAAPPQLSENDNIKKTNTLEKTTSDSLSGLNLDSLKNDPNMNRLIESLHMLAAANKDMAESNKTMAQVQRQMYEDLSNRTGMIETPKKAVRGL